MELGSWVAISRGGDALEMKPGWWLLGPASHDKSARGQMPAELPPCGRGVLGAEVDGDIAKQNQISRRGLHKGEEVPLLPFHPRAQRRHGHPGRAVPLEILLAQPGIDALEILAPKFTTPRLCNRIR